MGMVLPQDEEYLWIAEESLLAPLPEGKISAAVSTIPRTIPLSRRCVPAVVSL